MPHFTVRLGDKEIDLPEADTRDQALLKAGLTPAHWPALHVGTEVQTDTSIHSQTKEKERNIAKKATQGNSTTPAPSAQLVFETVTKVDFALIVGNPYQPESRKKPPADVLERMAASIQEHGLLQTPVVRSTRQGYEMGDGWIRACAYRKLWDDTKDKKWRDLPVVIREMTDKQMADLVMEANTVRNDLSAIDLAKFYKRYMADFKVTQTELARIHHITQGEVANTIRLLELPENIQAKVISHEISETHARTLLQVSDPKEITRMADKVSKDGLSVVELDRQVKADLWNKTLSLDEKDNFGGGPRFDISACEKCDHRVMVKDPWQSKKEAVPRCNDRDCWSKKQGEANIAANQKQLETLLIQIALDSCLQKDLHRPFKNMSTAGQVLWQLKADEVRAVVKAENKQKANRASRE